MATSPHPPTSPLCSPFLLLLLLLSLIASPLQGATASHGGDRYHVAPVTSLLPPSACRPSSKVPKGASLGVIHRHGPCSQSRGDAPTLAHTLALDQLRVDSIHSRLSSRAFMDSKPTIPAKSGRPIGTGNYVVTLSLGTPEKSLTVVFDTGSDLTWIQCLPCPTCYRQVDPLFNPSASTTYANVSCASATCTEIASAACAGATCGYRIRYGDGSATAGWVANDALRLGASDAVGGFLFGCGQSNTGLFEGAAGILGLGRDDSSIVSQTAGRYHRVFSYCLPTTGGSNGRLTFGAAGGGSGGVMYTPLASRGTSLYFIELAEISVGGRPLSIPAAVFGRGTLIDSGTVVTRLPAEAYAALRSAFRQGMRNYTMVAPSIALFDTCYDLSQYDTVSIPTISLAFAGNAKIEMRLTGTLIGPSTAELCLAFAGNRYEDSTAILGNLQQVTYDITYDVGGNRLGFRQGGCD